MLEWISWIFVCILTILVDNYLYSTMTGVRYPKIDLKFVLLTISLAVINTCASIYLPYNIKMYFNFLIYIIYFKIVYKHEYEKIIITEFLIYIIAAIAETIFFSTTGGLLKLDVNVFLQDPSGRFVLNAFMLIFPIFVISFNIILNVFKFIIKWYREKKTLNLFVMVFLVLYVCFKVMLNIILLNTSSFWKIFSNSSVGIIFLIFIFFFLRQKTVNKKISLDYDLLLNYVENYEKLLDEQSKKTHEFKNQLIIIENMDSSNKVKDYIKDLLDDFEEEILNDQCEKLQYFPSGGLKGLCYHKLSIMEEKKITYYVDVEKSFLNSVVKEICNKNLKDVSKIIGVFLDNAIDSCENCQDKKIIIEARYVDSKIIFSFSNSFEGNLDFSKIGNEGYSTKGAGKGHGLALVRAIIKKHANFNNITEISGLYFVQKLVINL